MKYSYCYINKIGIKKEIIIEEENGVCDFSVWNVSNGEFCGSGKTTKTELEEFLSNYNLVESGK